MLKYNHEKIEKKWQAYWLKHKTFLAKDFSKKPKKYVLVEFPYPSGEGLHMGHLRPYVAGDVFSRYHRLNGKEVIFPMGWDAFGLPAENYAIKTGVNPAITTKQNIANAKKQMLSWGLSFDWSREVNTTDPEYYKWTQWLFLQFYKAGLAYEATGLINWCPKDKTGLANEEVIDGKCERCGTVVEKKELRQWYLRITAYAEKLLDGLKTLNQWPEAVKLQQENWIGKSVGAEIYFPFVQVGVKRFVILHAKGGSSSKNFIPWLKKELESCGYEVQAPNMPNPDKPDDIKQAEFVKKNCTIDEKTVIIGHSFGGVVAMRLLEQGIKANRTILIATPFTGQFLDGKKRPTVTSALEKGFDFETIKKNSTGFTFLYDVNDAVVPVSDGEAYAKNLGFGVIKVSAKEKHFGSVEEPEVLSVALGAIKVFTTRPDTIYGGTFLVISPEHPLVEAIVPHLSNSKEVIKYIEAAKNKTDMQRSAEEKEKTGVVLKDVFVVNPATKEKIPVWIADFVLANYGTGAVFADAHDERDFAFAKRYKIPLKTTLKPKDGSDDSKIRNLEICFPEKGILYDSGEFSGLTSEEAIPKMAAAFGKVTTQYKLRDWVFSRQRYWGEPIPIIHCEDDGIVPVPEKDLPVKLPPVKKYEPTGTGESPLADIASWVKTKCPKCGKVAWRETNTMPQWAGSSWYWLRYLDPKNKKGFSDIKKQKYWTPVDVYFGGMEHTTLHLLYSRFWNLFLYDQGLVAVKEPYTLRKPHGIVLGPDGEKMSKSRGNVVNPDEVVKKFGADTLRMYELFLGPHEAMVSWNDQGIVGVRRFLDRVWYWVNEVALAPHQKNQDPKNENQTKDTDKVQKALNKLIKKVTEDLENFRFNTSVSAFMEFYNEIKEDFITLESLKTFLVLLYPFAPHLSEELHSAIGGKGSLQAAQWPSYDASKIVETKAVIIVQINGKVKGKLEMSAGGSQDSIQAEALKLEPVKEALIHDSIKRVVFVKDRLINLVI